jgi:hypothetical protein
MRRMTYLLTSTFVLSTAACQIVLPEGDFEHITYASGAEGGAGGVAAETSASEASDGGILEESADEVFDAVDGGSPGELGDPTLVESEEEPVRLKVMLTDAPGAFEAVPVTISAVKAFLVDEPSEPHADGGAALAEGDAGAPSEVEVDGGAMMEADESSDDLGVDGGVAPSESAGRWVTLVDTPQTYDLLELQDGVLAHMGDALIPAGHYEQIRLIVSDAAVVVDGVTHELFIPSGEQTGLKFNHDFSMAPGADYELVLDFDAHESVRAVGGSGPTGAGPGGMIQAPETNAGVEYLLTPVIHVAYFGPERL